MSVGSFGYFPFLPVKLLFQWVKTEISSLHDLFSEMILCEKVIVYRCCVVFNIDNLIFLDEDLHKFYYMLLYTYTIGIGI